MNFKVNYWDR